MYTYVCVDIFYRNFKRPMAVQDKKNEQHYIDNYNVSNLNQKNTCCLQRDSLSNKIFSRPQYLKQTLKEGLNLIALNQGPFHYGSHYSNSGTVLHFLVRLPPFTSMFLSYQGNGEATVLVCLTIVYSSILITLTNLRFFFCR